MPAKVKLISSSVAGGDAVFCSEFERHIPIAPADFACGDDAPMGAVCFEGTMQIGGAPKN